METAPLTLSLLRLTPHTIFPPTNNLSAPSYTPVPLNDASTPSPPLPPPQTLSPTHNYPSPFGQLTLGSSLSLLLNLANTSQTKDGITGIRMMCEVQTPTTRYRLGEVIHGQKGASQTIQDTPNRDVESSQATNTEATNTEATNTEATNTEVPEREAAGEEEDEGMGGDLAVLPFGESVQLDVESEMKELGLCIVICSVAWETDQGRRTFQRFLKYTVIPPLSIKTRIQTSPHPNILLDPILRNQTNLEILIQNSSTEPLLFDNVQLEPVHNLLCTPIPPPLGLKDESLFPGDTRQYLFTLSPTPTITPTTTSSDGQAVTRTSVFPPIYPGGSILPLGRLDVSWFAGKYRHPGRLQTSTLNRRIPVVPIGSAGVRGQTLTRGEYGNEEDDYGDWEFDLSVLKLERSGVEVEKVFEAALRVGVRSRYTVPSSSSDMKGEGKDVIDELPPPPLRIGIQYLSPPTPSIPDARKPDARAPTPVPPPRLSTPVSAVSAESRTMSPVSSQLRQATSQHLSTPVAGPSILRPPHQFNPIMSTFPPPPAMRGSAANPQPTPGPFTSGQVTHLGASLTILDPVEFKLVEENVGTTYNVNDQPPKRWEALYEHTLRFIALDEGLAELGGLRVLLMHEPEGESLRGSVGKEWESLGDVYVEG